jgi:ribosome-binding factor A
MQPNRRTARVRELLKHEIAECIRRELSIEEVGLLTVNDVGLASDLRSATVFVGFVGTAAQKKKAPSVLASVAGRIQSMVGGAVRLKFTPELRFQLDDSIEQGSRIVALLDALERENPTAAPVPPAKMPVPPRDARGTRKA